MSGGTGADVFVFAVTEAGIGDVITDFQSGQDRIEVSGHSGAGVNFDVQSDRVVATVNGLSIDILTDLEQTVTTADFDFV